MNQHVNIIEEVVDNFKMIINLYQRMPQRRFQSILIALHVYQRMPQRRFHNILIALHVYQRMPQRRFHIILIALHVYQRMPQRKIPYHTYCSTCISKNATKKIP